MVSQAIGEQKAGSQKKIEALLELSFADKTSLKRRGVGFTCETCPERVQKLRRCREDREDFAEADGNIWPMYVSQGGPMFGFCPGKATWDHSTVNLYRLLIITAETGALYNSGGISEQPEWFVDLLAWFLPRYNDLRFYSRAKAILGESSPGEKISGR